MTKLDKYCITTAIVVLMTWMYIYLNKIDMGNNVHLGIVCGVLAITAAFFSFLLEQFKMITYKAFIIHHITICCALYFWYWSKPEDYDAISRAWPLAICMNMVIFLTLKFWRFK